MIDIAASVPTVPLSQALLCLDCETIYPIYVSRCPSCSSRQAMSMARVLDRGGSKDSGAAGGGPVR